MQDLTALRFAGQKSQGTSPAFKGTVASSCGAPACDVWSVVSCGLVGKKALQRGH